jgi:hypothetical protein
MEPESSLPQWQAPATCPCPQPDQSIPRPFCHFLKIHFRFILRFTPTSCKWSLSLRLRPTLSFSCPHACHMPGPSHSWFYHPYGICWGLQITKLTVMQSSPVPCLPYVICAKVLLTVTTQFSSLPTPATWHVMYFGKVIHAARGAP